MNSNFRQRYSLLLLVGVIVSSVAMAKAPISQLNSESLEYRITQLERIATARGQLLTEYEQKISNLQRDIDDLRGQIQQNQYELQKIKEKPQSGKQEDIPFSDSQAKIQAITPENKNNEKQDYDEALFFIFEKKAYDQAITRLQHFVEQYPQSTYQPNAYYWLGQLFYNKGIKDKASYYYAMLVKKYVTSPKRPDAMLKVGIIMQETGKPDTARQVYKKIMEEYPQSAAAKEAKKRLGAAPKR